MAIAIGIMVTAIFFVLALGFTLARGLRSKGRSQAATVFQAANGDASRQRQRVARIN
jgi:hypothetical protein